MVPLIHSVQSYLSLLSSKGDSRILGDFVENFCNFIFFSKITNKIHFSKAKSNY
jgi:hypothetical protein